VVGTGKKRVQKSAVSKAALSINDLQLADTGFYSVKVKVKAKSDGELASYSEFTSSALLTVAGILIMLVLIVSYFIIIIIIISECLQCVVIGNMIMMFFRLLKKLF
jgi:hypothetical protein